MSVGSKLIAIASLAVAVTALASPVSAHHSTAMFDWGKSIEIPAATVESWEWTNPHTFLYVTVPNASGGTDRWAFEGMSPSHLARAGWSRKSLEPGEKISMTYYALKDGRKGGFVVTVTPPDGKKMNQLPTPMP